MEFFAEKGLQIGFDFRDVWREEHLAAFTAAKIMERDILAEVRDTVQKALTEGKTFREWKKEIEPSLMRSGWIRYHGGGKLHRYRTIYDTNMRTARAVGQWERVQRTKELRPNLIYRLGPSERHRPEHELLDGFIAPIDDPVWGSYYPPNGWGCKCWVRQISDRQTTQLGGVSPPKPIERVRHVNKRTGEVSFPPRGVDPGWDYSPGDRFAGLQG
jgi:SPP1 gp7 family putative phage head morphogenesis protein